MIYPHEEIYSAINLLLSSIVMEELGLAHIINAEGEKLQYILGTIPGLAEAATIEDVLNVNRSVQETLSTVIKKEMVLDSKLKQVTCIMSLNGEPGPPGPQGPPGDQGPVGDQIGLFYVSDGLTVNINLGAGIPGGTIWSMHKIADLE